MLAALIFDVDGTLADTERDGHRVAFNAAFAERGLAWDWTPDLYGELLAVTGGKERIRYYVERWLTDFRAPTDLDAFIANLHAGKTRHYAQLLRSGGIPLRPGVRRLLEEARTEGLRLAIATTTTPANVEILIETSLGPQARAWFEVIGAGDVVAAKKPAPDIYDHVLRAMNLPPQVCLAFEDSANGLRAARAAGLACLVTVNDYTRDQDFGGALAVLDGFGEEGRPARLLDETAASDGALKLPHELVADVALLRELLESNRR
jgi:beta-phosphoglucomutase-like phosphatase (HAD superfamily)